MISRASLASCNYLDRSVAAAAFSAFASAVRYLPKVPSGADSEKAVECQTPLFRRSGGSRSLARYCNILESAAAIFDLPDFSGLKEV